MTLWFRAVCPSCGTINDDLVPQPAKEDNLIATCSHCHKFLAEFMEHDDEENHL